MNSEQQQHKKKQKKTMNEAETLAKRIQTLENRKAVIIIMDS